MMVRGKVSSQAKVRSVSTTACIYLIGPCLAMVHARLSIVTFRGVELVD